jgi:heterotetrameric sarcosine oxidase gamma subunit
MKLQPQSSLGAPFGTARLVAGFKTNGVSLRERADIGCVLVTTAANNIAAAASAVAGVELPGQAGEIRTHEGRSALWLSPRSWLIQCRLEDELVLVARLNSAFPDKQAHAVPFTDALCWLELFGVESQEALTEGGFLSLEPGGLHIGHAKRTLIAGVAVILAHERENVWVVGVERSRAGYFAQWLSENSHLPSFKRLA